MAHGQNCRCKKCHKKNNGFGFPNAEKSMRTFEKNSDKIGMKIRKGGVKVIGNTNEAIKGLEDLSEMGFTKKAPSSKRNKNDAFAKIGL